MSQQLFLLVRHLVRLETPDPGPDITEKKGQAGGGTGSGALCKRAWEKGHHGPLHPQRQHSDPEAHVGQTL